MENKVDINTIVKEIENHSNSFKKGIDDMNFMFGEIENKLQYFSVCIADMTDTTLAELHKKYGIEESQENYDKVKAGIIDSVRYNVNYFIENLNNNVNYFIENLNRMIEEL